MSDRDKWVEITVLTSHEAVEAVSAIFYDAGTAGVAIEDPSDIINSTINPKSWDYIDEKLLVGGEEVKVKGYFPCNDEMDYAISYIKSSVGKLEDYGLDKGKGEVIVKMVKEEDWAFTWKQYYKPFRIGDNIVIKPTWEDYDSKPGDILVELDPGMAFGTGTHETTRMCIELLQKYVNKGCTVYDIGCGSGILSIVSSKLGAGRVVGVDLDEVAVRASRENVEISKADNVEIMHGNLFDVVKGSADVIVANIIADVIINICETTRAFLNPGGIFISSGIIKDRAEDVEKALKNNGYNILQVKKDGEWVAFASSVRE